jgi:serine/threonine protein kinase
MGEVYKARDTRLQRSVAIKILPSSFATDPERLARFEREAQVLASLNHPNIAHIYGVEETGGALALVMELVEGPTLAEVLAHHRPHGSGATRSGSWDIDPLAVARLVRFQSFSHRCATDSRLDRVAVGNAPRRRRPTRTGPVA